MKTETIIVANLKCDGCEKSIKNKLTIMSGVKSVIVDQDKDLVIIKHEGKIDRKQFLNSLNNLGYPEATKENGLLLKLKSYVSCAIGKMSM
jgi:copper chaperone CopZ